MSKIIPTNLTKSTIPRFHTLDLQAANVPRARCPSQSGIAPWSVKIWYHKFLSKVDHCT